MHIYALHGCCATSCGSSAQSVAFLWRYVAQMEPVDISTVSDWPMVSPRPVIAKTNYCANLIGKYPENLFRSALLLISAAEFHSPPHSSALLSFLFFSSLFYLLSVSVSHSLFPTATLNTFLIASRNFPSARTIIVNTQ